MKTHLTADANSRRTGAFTLIELLTVIVIILMLLGLGVFAYQSAMSSAGEAVAQQMFKSVGVGLMGYRNDCKSFPPSRGEGGTFKDSGSDGTQWFGTWTSQWEGGELVTQALLGPQTQNLDGHNGVGFRFQGGGRVYGPYVEMNADRSLLARWDRNNNGYADEGTEFWEERQQRNAYVISIPAGGRPTPMLYYLKGPSDHSSGTWEHAWSKGGQFDTDHNRFLVQETNRPLFKEYSSGGEEVAEKYPVEQQNKKMTEFNSADYLLVWAGADGSFGMRQKDAALREGPESTPENVWSNDDLTEAGPR